MGDSRALVICMVLIAASMAFPPYAVADNHDDIIIESDVTWGSEDSMNVQELTQNVRIVNGGSLTLENSVLRLDEGVEIYVDSTSSINARGFGYIEGVVSPSGLAGYGYCDEGNRSAIHIVTNSFGDSNRNVRVTFWPIEGYNLDGVTAYFGENVVINESGGTELVWSNDSELMSGDEFSIMLGAGPIDMWVGFVGPMCHPVSLSEIRVSELGQGGQSFTEHAANFTYQNMMVHGDHGFTLSIDGTMDWGGCSFNPNSNIWNEDWGVACGIIGGQIIASGQLTFNDTILIEVGPVILNSDNASIYLGGNTQFRQSTDDHDVRAMAHSTIEWEDNVTGSGGLTDKWERRLAGQYLMFDARYVTYEISGMHNTPSYSNFSDENGLSYVKNGDERVVEIAWSDDNTWESDPIWTEQAVVTITDYRTAWNPEGSGIVDYGGGQFSLGWQSEIVVDQVIPNIEWVSITAVGDDGNSASAGAVGDSLSIEAVIGNTGTAAAILAIDCNVTSTGVPAEMSPTWPNAMIGPGQQEAISFSWRYQSAGDEGLTCRILTPTQLVDDLAFGGGEMASENISWQEVEDDEGLTYILPIMLALVIGIAIGGYVLINRAEEGELVDDYQRIP